MANGYLRMAKVPLRTGRLYSLLCETLDCETQRDCEAVQVGYWRQMAIDGRATVITKVTCQAFLTVLVVWYQPLLEALST
jgi:hypothetical protein